MISPPILIETDIQFPDEGPLYEPKTTDGLCFIGGNLLPENLLRAYRNGVFPWSVNPVTWWSPTRRAIFEFDKIRPPRRLSQLIRQKKFKVTFDTCFTRVMEECATLTMKRHETWISESFIDAYSKLHVMGISHSCEVWLEGVLVGGIYGVSIGGLFAGESMFSRANNASSVGLFHLFEYLRAHGFTLFDTQVMNPHTQKIGAIEISRTEYLTLLKSALEANCSPPIHTPWT